MSIIVIGKKPLKFLDITKFAEIFSIFPLKFKIIGSIWSGTKKRKPR